MTNKTFKDIAIRMKNTTSNSTGWVTLTPYVNQNNLKRTIKLIEDTAYGDGAGARFIPGVADTKASVNGWVNSTTDALLGYFFANNTSVSRKFELQTYSGRFYNGNAYLSDLQYSGSLHNMETFSFNIQFDGTVNRTSVQLVS